MKNVLEWLEETANTIPGKIAVSDETEEISFKELTQRAKAIGTYLSSFGRNNPIVVCIDKSCKAVEAMMGVLYSGNHYVVLDVHSPKDRIETIISTLGRTVLISDYSAAKLAEEVCGTNLLVSFETAAKSDVDNETLIKIRDDAVDVDPAYILFTSGSTGKPKGTVVNHKSLISYIDWISKEFKFNQETVFASQTPLYFSMSVTDLYSTIKCGCTYHIIPRQLFLFPINIIEFLNEKRVNTIYWVPTALSIIANWKTFEEIKPEYLKLVLFAGEVMPTKQLNYWIKNLPSVTYANLFGPTETTDICTFYVVDRKFEDDENLPIGKHCDNCDVFVVKEDGRQAEIGEEGELFVRSSFVASGYYKDSEKTAQAFVQNPLNDKYPETVYRTGDIVRIDSNGELLYVSRRDFQIKRSGYRIELGEIEAGANSVEKVKGCVCVYDSKTDCLALFYEGGPKDTATVYKAISRKVPSYMLPDKIVRVKQLPLNANGKIDRVYLTKKINSYIE